MKNMLIAGMIVLCLAGCRTLGMAVIDQNFAEVDSLLKTGTQEIDDPDHTGTTPLLYAVSYGHPAMVKYLLDKGANIEARHAYTKRTPLLEGSYYGNVAVVEILVDRGADIQAVDGSGYNPLEYARKFHWDKIEKLLLDSGAKPIY